MQVQFPGFQRIVTDPAICNGQPRVDGTRITIAAILSYIAGGLTVEDVVKEYPALSKVDIYQALSFAAAYFQDRYLPIRLSNTI